MMCKYEGLVAHSISNIPISILRVPERLDNCLRSLDLVLSRYASCTTPVLLSFLLHVVPFYLEPYLSLGQAEPSELSSVLYQSKHPHRGNSWKSACSFVHSGLEKAIGVEE